MTGDVFFMNFIYINICFSLNKGIIKGGLTKLNDFSQLVMCHISLKFTTYNSNF